MILNIINELKDKENSYLSYLSKEFLKLKRNETKSNAIISAQRIVSSKVKSSTDFEARKILSLTIQHKYA